MIKIPQGTQKKVPLRKYGKVTLSNGVGVASAILADPSGNAEEVVLNQFHTGKVTYGPYKQGGLLLLSPIEGDLEYVLSSSRDTAKDVLVLEGTLYSEDGEPLVISGSGPSEEPTNEVIIDSGGTF